MVLDAVLEARIVRVVCGSAFLSFIKNELPQGHSLRLSRSYFLN